MVMGSVRRTQCVTRASIAASVRGRTATAAVLPASWGLSTGLNHEKSCDSRATRLSSVIQSRSGSASWSCSTGERGAFMVVCGSVVGQLAGVPGAQGQLAEPGHEDKQGDPGEGNQQQRCEHAWDVQLVTCHQNLVGQACARAACAGHK